MHHRISMGQVTVNLSMHFPLGRWLVSSFDQIAIQINHYDILFRHQTVIIGAGSNYDPLLLTKVSTDIAACSGHQLFIMGLFRCHQHILFQFLQICHNLIAHLLWFLIFFPLSLPGQGSDVPGTIPIGPDWFFGWNDPQPPD